jgi:hypothetical protein
MQNIDRPDDVQALVEPARRRGLRVQLKRRRLRPEKLHRIAAHLRRRRDVRAQPAVGTAEAQPAIGQSIGLITLLVHRAMVPATEQGEIRERGGATVRPVADVMTLTEPPPDRMSFWQRGADRASRLPTPAGPVSAHADNAIGLWRPAPVRGAPGHPAT